MPSGAMTVNELELLSLDVLGNDPDAATEFSLLLREFVGGVALLIAETLQLADPEAFMVSVMEGLGYEGDSS